VRALVDTSVLVRYLTGDPPDLAELAAGVLDHTAGLLIPHMVLAETAYVLTSVYGVEREAVVDHLVDLLQKENIDTLGGGKELAIRALLLCRPSGRVSFVDALVWAAAHSSGVRRVYTLDGRFPADGLELGPQAPR